jgi:signal transduction histidine kinase
VESNRVRVFVADEGQGIPESEQDLLFERFARGSAARDSSGTGLGLYLSKAIIDAHGGAIWVESAPGQGATFHFALPLEEQAAPVEASRARAPDTEGQSPSNKGYDFT